MLKRVLGLCLVLLLLVTSNLTITFALETQGLEDSEIVSGYETIRWNDIGLSKTNGKADISVLLQGSSGVKFKNGTLKLYKLEKSTWTTINTWSNLSSSSNSFSFSNNSVAVQSGTKYKIKIAITAYTGNKSEKIVLDMTKEL